MTLSGAIMVNNTEKSPSCKELSSSGGDGEQTMKLNVRTDVGISGMKETKPLQCDRKVTLQGCQGSPMRR